MTRKALLILCAFGLGFVAATVVGLNYAQNRQKKSDPTKQFKENTYLPIVAEKSFEEIYKEDTKQKPKLMQRQKELLAKRYDLSNNPSKVKMSARRKAVQQGVRIKLPKNVTRQALAKMSPEEIKDKDLFPMGVSAVWN